MTPIGLPHKKYLLPLVAHFLCCALFIVVVGCAPLKQDPPKADSPSIAARKDFISSPPSVRELTASIEGKSPEALQDDLSTYGENWLYGQGFGNTLLNLGTVVIFPPYALYLVGNAGLALAGFEPIYVTDALPDTPREEILSVYGHLASIPGAVAAKIAGREEATLQD